MVNRTSEGRHVLLLQGPRSTFFTHLADALEARGARVSRVLFCPGDALYWGRRPAFRHRGSAAEWAEASEELMRRHAVSDVVGLGSGRELHADAFSAARRVGVRVHVVEQGYLRPGFLTVERDTLGAWRPDDAALASADEPPAAARWRGGFFRFAAMDIAYDLANLGLGRALYPGYRSHIPHGPLAEWRGWVRKAARWPARRSRLRRALAAISDAEGPIFLFALQLEADFQVRLNGPADGLRGALARASASFAAHAPAGARLAVKPHPLDPQLVPWERLSREGPAGDRTIFLDGGSLEALAPRLSGLVTVNSTAGLSALRAGRPVLTLGHATYDRPGLTHQSGLDKFWSAPERPDPSAVRAFVAALAKATQVPGAFEGEGVRPGAAAVADRILELDRARASERAA